MAVDSSSALQTLSRRKWLALAGVVIILGGALGMLKGIRPSYKATATLLLTPPALSAEQALALKDPGSQNPVLSFSDSLNVLASVTVSALANDSQLKSAAAQNHATFSLQTQTGTPSIAVSATAKNPADANAADAAITKIVQSDIAARQTALGAPTATHVQATVITPGGRTSPINSKRTKLLMIWVALGAAITLGAISSVDKRKMGDRTAAEEAQPQFIGGAPRGDERHSPIEEGPAAAVSRPTGISARSDNNDVWLPANGSTGKAVLSRPASSVVRPIPTGITRSLSRSFGPPRGPGLGSSAAGQASSTEPEAADRDAAAGNGADQPPEWPPMRDRSFPNHFRRPPIPADTTRSEIRITRPSTPD
jgi:capsular polysaccharide biosynthesis protein